MSHSAGDVVEAGRKKALRRMERSPGSNSNAGGDGTRSKDQYLRSRRRKPLSHAEGLVGSTRAGDTTSPTVCKNCAQAIQSSKCSE